MVRQPYTLQSGPPDISSPHLAPHRVTAVLLTTLALLYFTPCDCFVTADPYFSIPLFFSSSSPRSPLWQPSVCSLQVHISVTVAKSAERKRMKTYVLSEVSISSSPFRCTWRFLKIVFILNLTDAGKDPVRKAYTLFHLVYVRIFSRSIRQDVGGLGPQLRPSEAFLFHRTADHTRLLSGWPCGHR